MRFVATADWQLGMTAHFLSDEARPRFHQARLDAVRRIGELAQERDASFILVCGDVFETNQLDRSIVHKTFEALRTCQVPVLLLPGNHDPLDAASIYDSDAFTRKRPANVHVLRGEPFTQIDGVEVISAPWHSKRPGRDLVAEATAGLGPTPDGVVRVVAGHGGVLSFGNEDPDALIDLDALRAVIAEGRADVVILGDHHSTEEIEERIWYPGTPEVTRRTEVDPGNVLVVDVDPALRAATFKRVPVGRWRFRVMDVSLNAATDVEQLDRDLRAIDRKDRTVVWLKVTGSLSTSQYARYEDVIDELTPLFASLEEWGRHADLVVMPDGDDFSGLGLTGYAQDALDELIAQATSGVDDARGALGLLYRLAGGTR